MTITVDRLAKDPCARLAARTHGLAGTPPTDTREVLLTVWDGLADARLTGLQAATASPAWRVRQRCAEALEFDLALQLARDCTVGTGRALPARIPPGAPVWLPDRADAAVATIITFCRTAEAALREAGARRPVWEDGLLGPVALTRWLGDCWAGHHTCCPLQLPVPPPAWWR